MFATLYLKDKGVTIGYSAGKDREMFDRVASEIASRCSYAGSHALNLSIRGIGKEVLAQLVEYIGAQGATRTNVDATAISEQQRWTGPRGDKLTLTLFTTTGTLQIQGINAHLATMVMDMLRVLASEATALTMDIDAFSIPVTVEDALRQTEARLPAAHDWIHETVRKQLSSAQVMTLTKLPLEDFSLVAFPALRGLEGFMKQVYCTVGTTLPPENLPLGDWFEKKGTSWAMREINAMHVGAKLAAILIEGYTLYYSQRHSLLHMAFDIETTRILQTIEEAQEVVERVFKFVEVSCASIRS